MRRMEDFAAELFDVEGVVAVGLDAESKVRLFNRGAELLTGCARAEALGKDWFDAFLPQACREEVRSLFVASLPGDPPLAPVYDHPVLARSGEERLVRWYNRDIRRGGRRAGTLSIGVDRTDLARAEESRERYLRRLQAVLDASPAAIVSLDLDDKVTLWSPGAERLFGWRADEVLGRPYPLVPASARAEFREGLREVRGGRRVPPRVVERARKDGTVLPVRLTLGPMRTNGGSITGTLGVLEDVTEELRRLEGERADHEFIASVLDGIQESICVIDLDGLRVVRANKAFLASCGRPQEEVLGRPCWELTHAECGPCSGPAEPCPIGLEAKTVEHCHRDARGEPRQVEVSTYPLKGPDGKVERVVHVARDLSERLSLEAQLRQAQKLESLGRLAGGVAHDFNNLLTAMLGYADFAIAQLQPGDRVRADVEGIRATARRAAALTRQLLAFSRRQVLAPRVVDAGELVAGMHKLLRRLLPETVELSIGPAERPLPVRADPGQVEQVLVNLAVNAGDAMPSGGRLSIAAGWTEQRPSSAEADSPQGWVRLAVADTGTGMSPEALKHLFEPFFTTKEAGKGTGLGLATCFGIVRQSGGVIEIESSPGKGTTVQVFLPLSTEPAEAASAEAPDERARGRGETVLLVEDEPSLRAVTARMLEDLGYRVLQAGDGEEALRLEGRPEAADLRLVLTDLVMPRLGGRELAVALAARRPKTRVLFMSGYVEESALRSGGLDPRTTFLQKPFGRAELAARVRETLDAPDRP